MELHGRDPEREALAAARAAVRDDGAAQVVALVGEAGIGKSALLAELRERALADGLLVLEGRAAEHDRDVPFGVVVDALDEHVGTLNPARLATIGPELGAVLPAAADPGGPPPATDDAPGPAERFRHHRTLRALLELLGRERPVVLLLDDVHWADEASLELLLHLLRRPPRVPLLLAMTLRPTGAGARLLDAGRRASGWREVPVGPLASEAARALLPAGLDRAAAERIVADAAGNPLFLRELGRLGEPAAATLPGTVAAAIGQELDALGDGAARDLLSGAAVAGDPFDLDVAAAAGGVPASAAPAALDVLVAADLVAAAGAARRFRFRHPLVHRAAYDATPPGWRLGAHERAAQALAARGASPAVRAFHVERCAAAGDAHAVALLEAAGIEVQPTAPGAAAHWYGAALRLLAHDDDDGRRRLLGPWAQALLAAGQLEESLAALEAAAELVAPGDEAARVELAVQAANVEVLLGAFDAADARLRALEAHVSAGAHPWLMLHRASAAFFRSDAEAQLRWSQQTIAALDSDGGAGDPVLRAWAGAVHAGALAEVGRDAGAVVDAAAARLERVDDAALGRAPRATWGVGGTLGQLERYRAAVVVLTRGVRVARATRQDHLFLHLHTLLAMNELPLLDLDGALAHVEAAEEAARLQGLTHELAFALCQRGRVLDARGEPVEAERAAAESDELLRALGAPAARPTVAAHNAIVRLGADPERLLRALAELAGPDVGRVGRTGLSPLLIAAVRAALAIERTADAERWTVRLEEIAAGGGLPATAVRAVRARAELLLAAGDGGAAAGAAADAVAVAEDADLPAEALASRLLLGRAQLAAGDRDAGLDALQRAAADAARAGAAAARDAAAREVRRAGGRLSADVRRAAAAATGDTPLTERERSIAELVAGGRSNKEVAAALFLSEKTVEANLTRIYAKLGVRSRTELAAVLR